jgi:lysophospholipase L1-like esterase
MLEREGDYDSVSLTNLAHSGDDSQDLLRTIETQSEIISNADVVTVCIGGNNFLGTVIGTLFSAAAQIMEPSEIYDFANLGVPDEVYEQAAKTLETPALQAILVSGVEQFSVDFPEIIARIHILAPTARIYAMTVYNPLEPEHPMYAIIDQVENQMNDIIKGADGITVVDVYAEFERLNGQGKLLLSLGGVDPHPSVFGQTLIANLHYTAITGNSISYAVTPAAAGPTPSPAETPSEEIDPTPAAMSTLTVPTGTPSPVESPTSDTVTSVNWVIWVVPMIALTAIALWFAHRRKSKNKDL